MSSNEGHRSVGVVGWFRGWADLKSEALSDALKVGAALGLSEAEIFARIAMPVRQPEGPES